MSKPTDNAKANAKKPQSAAQAKRAADAAKKAAKASGKAPAKATAKPKAKGEAQAKPKRNRNAPRQVWPANLQCSVKGCAKRGKRGKKDEPKMCGVHHRERRAKAA